MLGYKTLQSKIRIQYIELKLLILSILNLSTLLLALLFVILNGCSLFASKKLRIKAEINEATQAKNPIQRAKYKLVELTIIGSILLQRTVASLDVAIANPIAKDNSFPLNH